MPQSGTANQVAVLSGSSWGKFIGVILGYAFAGPWGAVFGFILGRMHDNQRQSQAEDWERVWQDQGFFSANQERSAFTLGVVVLGAKMAKCDGRVNREEVDAFKRVFHVTPSQEAAISAAFNQARHSAEGFEPYAYHLAHVFRNKKAVLEEILSGLFIIGSADYASLSPQEIAFLKRVSFIFGFDQEEFARIAASSGAALPEEERPRNPTIEAFTVLGVKETATPEEIKKAYRALIREHHPDKLTAQGLPPEFVATATEKMKRINAAYDMVCKIKGIK